MLPRQGKPYVSSPRGPLCRPHALFWCALPHTRYARTGNGIRNGHPPKGPLRCAYAPGIDPAIDHDPFRSGIIQATCSLHPADGQIDRVICTWLPPGNGAPARTGGSPRIAPRRPDPHSAGGVSQEPAGRFGYSRARPGQAGLRKRHHPSRVTQDAPCRCRRPATKSRDRQAGGTTAARMMRRRAGRANHPRQGDDTGRRRSQDGRVSEISGFRHRRPS